MVDEGVATHNENILTKGDMPRNKGDALANKGGREDLSILSVGAHGSVAKVVFTSACIFVIATTLPDARSYLWARVVLVLPLRARAILPPHSLAHLA